MFGVIISAGLTAVAVVYLLESSWTWSEAWLLGAILSATDPVAVVYVRVLDSKVSKVGEGNGRARIHHPVSRVV